MYPACVDVYTHGHFAVYHMENLSANYTKLTIGMKNLYLINHHFLQFQPSMQMIIWQLAGLIFVCVLKGEADSLVSKDSHQCEIGIKIAEFGIFG